MQNIVNLPISALKRAGGAVSSVANNVAASLPRLPRLNGRRGSGTQEDVDVDEDFILKNSIEKLNLALKSTPSKDCATTAAIAVKSGCLMKRNDQGHWRKVIASIVPHWFLYYYEIDNADTPKGIIDLHFYMKMNIENGNTLKMATDGASDDSCGPLRSYYFMDDDPNVLREWITCILRERYQVVRDERDAYQQMQAQFSGEMATVTAEIHDSAQDRERLMVEIAQSRLAADDSLAAMQSILVVIGVTEEDMRSLNSPVKASQAVITAIKGSRQSHEQLLYAIEQKRLSDRQKYEDQILALEKQLASEKEARARSEARLLAEQREFEQAVNIEIRETLGRLDKANLNLQAAVAARVAAEERVSGLGEQKKLLVKEVKALRGKLQQSNETVENLMALTERTATGSFSGGAVDSASGHSPGSASLNPNQTRNSSIASVISAPATDGSPAAGEPIWRDSMSCTNDGKDDHESEDDDDEDDEPERQSWTMKASALKELGWLSTEQRQLVETRATEDPEDLKPLAATTPPASSPAASFSLAPFFSSGSGGGGSASASAASSKPSTLADSTDKSEKGSSSMSRMLSSIMGSTVATSNSSATNADSPGPRVNAPLSSPSTVAGVGAANIYTSENTVRAKAKVASFFSSPLPAETDADSSDRAPVAKRMQCLRCTGSVEGPKYSTCQCPVPALQPADLAADASRGSNMFTGMLSGIRRSSTMMAKSINETFAASTVPPTTTAPGTAAARIGDDPDGSTSDSKFSQVESVAL